MWSWKRSAWNRSGKLIFIQIDSRLHKVTGNRKSDSF